MSHESQILDETASLPFGRITRTQHSPLTRLKRTGSTNFSRLFKLTGDSGHHAQGRNITEPTEDMGNTGAFHLETLNGPVAGRYGTGEAGTDGIAVGCHGLDRVPASRSGRLANLFFKLSS